MEDRRDDEMDIDDPKVVQNVAGPSRPRLASNIAPAVRPRASSVPTGLSNYTVGYVYSTNMTLHEHPHPDGHPEQPARIRRIWEIILKAGLKDMMKHIPIRKVEKDEVLLVHSEDHWDKVIQLQHMTEQERADSAEYYDYMSLYVMPATTLAALLSCGGVIQAALAVARGEVKKSFAIVRPPGHHAEPDEHMGFCFFNNVAVAARVVQQSTPLKKIFILDWDVHHGNGTQRAFNEDPSVLYISLHRYEQGTFYPTGPFGSLESSGFGPGEGYSVNVPWPKGGMGDADYLHAFHKVIMPIAMEFAPDLVIISAGFDAAEGDDLGECHVSPAGYAHMTHMLSGLANGRLVVALEGGYNLDAISTSALAVTRVLLGQAPDALPAMVASDEGTETVWHVAKHQSKYWKSIDPKECEPQAEVEPISFSIPEILKAHRQHYLYTTYDMMQIPIVIPELEQRFSSQIMCTPDMLTNPTLVLFVHEFGNLRVQLTSSALCDIDLERSYLLDFSKQLISWVRKKNFSLLDANLFPKPVDFHNVTRNHKTVDESARDILLYLWDNYVQISDATKVILVGHGPGCRAVVDLLSRRATGAMKTVKVVVQIVGLQNSPHAPSGLDELRSWYKSRSTVVLPSSHPSLISPKEKSKETRRHGGLVSIDEPQPLKLVMKALPIVDAVVHESLEKQTNGVS